MSHGFVSRKNTGCPRRNVPDFGRVCLILKYTDITQNTYVQSWAVTEIRAREVWNFDSCYTLVDYQIHIKTGRNVISVMLISVLNIKLTCELHKAIKLSYKKKKTRKHVIFVLRVPSAIHDTSMASTDVTWLTVHSGISLLHNCTASVSWVGHHTQGQTTIRLVSWQVQCVDPPEDHTFLWPLSP